MGTREQKGGLRRVWSRLATSDDELNRERLQASAEKAGCSTLSDTTDRSKVRIRGVLRTVTLQPRRGMPALEAELYDGTGSVTLVWLGRRRITGITCGRRIVADGRISTLDGRRVMYNPSYDLLPEGADERV